MLKFEKRKISYLVGRYAAKQAISVLIGEKNLKSILVQKGIFGHPIATCLHEQNVQVSISHCNRLGAALAFSEAHPLGIDIEEVNAARSRALEGQITFAEKELIKNLPFGYDRMLTVLWTAKEALSKILKTGLTTPFHLFEVNKLEANHDYTISFFENFMQYKAISFDVGFSVCSIVCPRKTEITINIPVIQRSFDLSQMQSMKQEVTLRIS